MEAPGKERLPPLRKFEYFAPQSLSDALVVFQKQGEGGRGLAGGATVTNAIADAVSAPGRAGRLHEAPATPERILRALRRI